MTKDPDTEIECVCTDPPRRVQLSRRRGWRKPENTVVVARPSKFGNPFTIRSFKQKRGGRTEYSVRVAGGLRSYIQHISTARQVAVDEFRKWIQRDELNPYFWHRDLIDQHAAIRASIEQLRGRNLACWCPLDQPCHADVLLEIANGGVDV